jgi:hypothetical protein
MQDQKPATVDRLRADIDRGVTGEKVPASDPAAAPLGTDDEAGGAPPTPREIEMEARSRPTPPPQTSERGGRPVWVWAVGVLVVVLLILVVVGM